VGVEFQSSKKTAKQPWKARLGNCAAGGSAGKSLLYIPNALVHRGSMVLLGVASAKTSVGVSPKTPKQSYFYNIPNAGLAQTSDLEH
jgi:hypothetical protein